MKTKVYIDGQAGTTGLQIFDRIGSRDDLELLRIAEEKRHDNEERKKCLNAADIVFLCLPDDGAREAVSLIDNPNVRKHPSIYAEGIGHATSSVVYEILDISENGWYQIRLDNGKIGWISPAMGELEELEFNFDPTVLPETADAAK